MFSNNVSMEALVAATLKRMEQRGDISLTKQKRQVNTVIAEPEQPKSRQVRRAEERARKKGRAK